MSFEGIASIEQEIRLYKLMLAKEKKESDEEWEDIKESCGVDLHRDTLRKGAFFFPRLQALGLLNLEAESLTENHSLPRRCELGFKSGEYWSDKFLFVENENQLHDESFILKAHNFDPKVWTVVSAKSNFWDAPVKDGKKQMMYQSKITVKRRISELSFELIKESFERLDRNYSAPVKRHYAPDSDNILIVPISDLHFGRYSSALVSGEQYDMDIAEQAFFDVIEDIVSHYDGKPIEKIYFPIGNDMINSDNIAGTTQRGTQQDNDGLWQEIVLRCQSMIIKGIDMLAELVPVEVLYIKSNHDTQTSFQMYQFIAAWFRKDENITINQNYTDYQFIRYGNGIYGFAHDVKKKDNVHKLFDTYARQWLSETMWREMFLAHTHTEQIVYDNGGTVIRRLPTIAVPCKWSHENAYIGNARRSQCFLIDRKKGVVDTHNTVLI